MTRRAAARCYDIPGSLHTERHFTPTQVSQMWGLSETTIRELFADIPGVLKYEQPRLRGKRSYVSLRIPESILLQAHKRLTGSDKIQSCGSGV